VTVGLARFWAGLLGGTPLQWYPGRVTLEPPPHGQRLSFQATEADRQDVPGAVHRSPAPRPRAAAHTNLNDPVAISSTRALDDCGPL
jgi:hypothetical protein